MLAQTSSSTKFVKRRNAKEIKVNGLFLIIFIKNKEYKEKVSTRGTRRVLSTMNSRSSKITLYTFANTSIITFPSVDSKEAEEILGF